MRATHAMKSLVKHAELLRPTTGLLLLRLCAGPKRLPQTKHTDPPALQD